MSKPTSCLIQKKSNHWRKYILIYKAFQKTFVTSSCRSIHLHRPYNKHFFPGTEMSRYFAASLNAFSVHRVVRNKGECENQHILRYSCFFFFYLVLYLYVIVCANGNNSSYFQTYFSRVPILLLTKDRVQQTSHLKLVYVHIWA